MGKYPTTNIVYSGLEDKGGPTVTIIDEKKNKWTIWKADYENKDQDSDAYGSLKSYAIGESFGIEYGEKPESFTNRERKTINFTRRTIYKILPLVANPTQTPSRQESSNNEANRGQSGHSGDAFGRRLGVQGHINALLSNPSYWNGTGTLDIPRLVTDAIKVEEEAEKQLNPSPLREAVTRHAPSVVEEIPVIQVDEEPYPSGEDIPF